MEDIILWNTSSSHHQPPGAGESATTIAVSTAVSTATEKACFHCGEPGHESSTCSLRRSGVDHQGRSEAGKKAFQAYLKGVKAYNNNNQTRRTQKIPSKKKQSRDPLYHFHELREWMKDYHENMITDTLLSDNDDAIVVFDPVALVAKQQPHFHTVKDFEVSKHLHHSYRKFFSLHMERIRKRFNNNNRNNIDDNDNNNGSSSRRRKGQHDDFWQITLNAAVKDGRPADFSQKSTNDDIWIYADNKLIPRCRYLYYLLLDDNAFSARLRERLLLPAAIAVLQAEESGENGNVVRVCSIGGGPGYDHFAISLASWFLSKVQPTTISSQDDNRSSSSQCSVLPKTIKTQIFDLYDIDWLPIMEDLQECFEGEADAETTDREKGWWKQNQMTMHHGDLRLDLFDNNSDTAATTETTPSTMSAVDYNEQFLCSVRFADIIVFQFVLHENASFLVDNETGLIVGATASILNNIRGARKGTFLICTDSSYTLWPALKKTAAMHGWKFYGDAEKDHKISMGPKAFVILEKMT